MMNHNTKISYQYFWVFFCIAFLGACTSKTNPENHADTTAEPEKKSYPSSKPTRKPIILFLGNSLTAGFGVEKEESFPSLIQHKLDSMNANYQVVNAGVSGETTAGGHEKIEWHLKNKPHILVLELGGNDALRGIDPTQSYENLAQIIELVQQKYPKCKILLAGMEAPPNMGDDYTKRFREIYPKLEKKYQIYRIPFLLGKVGGNPTLNQPDGIHPTAQGHQIIAQIVWKRLKDLI